MSLFSSTTYSFWSRELVDGSICQKKSPTYDPKVKKRCNGGEDLEGESMTLLEVSRQITPPTKNGHAPPPTESRKSDQSVNPSSVRAW